MATRKKKAKAVEQIEDAPVKLGVYQNGHRNTCVVVRVKGPKVYYVTFITGTIEIVSSGWERFLHDWEYTEYPPKRAIRKYFKSELLRTQAAHDLMYRILTGSKPNVQQQESQG